MTIKNISQLLLAIAVSLSAGAIGSIATASSVSDWYPMLVLPSFSPPSWVFGPVWTTLFILMGVAAFLVWKKGFHRGDVKIALAVFLGQLVLNTLWSVIFFGLRSPGGALVEIVFLWIAIATTIVLFARISKPAAWLLSPYIFWVSFAAYLNAAIWMLN